MRRVVAIDIILNINSDKKKLRLDTYIAGKRNISRSKAQRLIQNGQVKLLGVPIINNDRIVKLGKEYIVHPIQPDVSTSIEPNRNINLILSMKIRIL
ncbi:hypothetical protein QUS22_00330 [Wolbachia pipientis]|nr:S4 domain-containing protein [Wolbachia pipientis]MDM8334852.1 hypothetical protein [Wolbachia pipientis]